MIILGINAFHADSSAALIRDGKLIAAAEEERFRRVKHWAGFPSDSIAYCLREAGLSLSDVDRIAINQDNRANMRRKVRYMAAHPLRLGLILERLRNREKRQSIATLLDMHFPHDPFRGEIDNVEHHFAHLSSAFHVSPFNRAAVVSIDGFGDFASSAWGTGENSLISVEGQVLFPHSLGIFYQAFTQYLGFPNYGDEYKVMGLAPYGQPRFLKEVAQTINALPDGSFELNLRYFRHHTNAIANLSADGDPKFADLFSPALESLLGPRRLASDSLEERHKDIARSAQVIYENILFNLLNNLQQKTQLRDIALAGGCAMNSVANGKIRRKTAFRRVYVQAAAGDAGGAIGAAFAVWHRQGGPRTFVMDHAYWGPEFDFESVASLLDAERDRIAEAGCTVERLGDENELCRRAATAIADGKVLGWFQGRMEWGPRALGNRSILCDPRRSDMKSILNAKIKRRESFRPFAPSVLELAVDEWFEENDAVPFMMQVFQIKTSKRHLIPAVTHVDGSGRLQTVSLATNPRYYHLIQRFAELTGIPMVLNTSFNENEPVVCRPEEALNCFLRTNMDALILGNTFISRQSADAPSPSVSSNDVVYQ
jgi:carbamoyltransferase